MSQRELKDELAEFLSSRRKRGNQMSFVRLSDVKSYGYGEDADMDIAKFLGHRLENVVPETVHSMPSLYYILLYTYVAGMTAGFNTAVAEVNEKVKTKA